jgi:uncharacterized protein HemY
MESSVPDALYAGGMWMLERDRALDAAHFFRAMLLAAPTDQRGWLGLATCHELLGQDEEAQDIYLAGTLAAEERGRCMVALSRLARRRGDPDKAERILDEAAELALEEGVEELITLERSAA